MIGRIAATTEYLIDHFQRIVSNPYFFLAGVFGTVGWIVYESFSPNPFDPPKSFFPFLILLMTIIGYWIESAMKVQQARQQEVAQEQMDRLEALAEDSNRLENVIQTLVIALDEAFDVLVERLKLEEDNEPVSLQSHDAKDQSDAPEDRSDETKPSVGQDEQPGVV